MNKIILIGRLTADPEIFQYSSSAHKTEISLAIKRKYSKEDENAVDYIKCIAFGAIGDIITKYCNKGDKIAIEGRLQIRKYINKNGENRSRTEVIIESMDFCGKKQNTNTDASNTYQDIPNGVDDDKLPWEI